MDTQKNCGNCKHFYQHYVKSGKRFIPLDQGHCVHPRLKDRTRSTAACPRFSENKSLAEQQ